MLDKRFQKVVDAIAGLRTIVGKPNQERTAPPYFEKIERGPFRLSSTLAFTNFKKGAGMSQEPPFFGIPESNPLFGIGALSVRVSRFKIPFESLSQKNAIRH